MSSPDGERRVHPFANQYRAATPYGPYQYQKLNHGEIRLLKFCSSPNEDLSFEIQHKPLDENTPRFAALSYTWGQADFPHRLLVGKKFLPITTNLRDALVHIRRRIASESNRLKKSSLLWVDAICINQSDTVEKNTQVALMSNLYVRASKVYVWLGMPENEPDVRAAASKLKYFYKRFVSSGKYSVPMRPFWWPNKSGGPDNFNIVRSFDPDDAMVFGVEGSQTHKSWLGIVEIWKKSWWNRAWILQEATVAEDVRILWFGLGPWPIWASTPNFKVIFMCGQYSTHWFAIIVSILVADHLQTMPLLNTAFLAGAQEPARKVLALRMQRQAPGNPELLGLLQRFRHAECSNPRDKVYSLLGLVPGPVKLHILPDYDKSVIEVYIDSFRHTLTEQTRNLDFLGYAMKLDSPRRAVSKEISDSPWPSWIPNWDDPLPLQPLPKILYSVNNKQHRSLVMFKNPEPTLFAKTAIGKVYNASLDFTTEASISGHQLNVEGVHVDVIVDLYSYQTMSWDQRRAKLTEWKCLLGGKYGITETFDDALARLQAADVQYHSLGYAVSRNYSVNHALLGKPNGELTPEEFKAKQAMRISLNSASSFRGLCLTKEGYVAVVPWSAKKGDRICVLLGGQVLYVLRDVNPELQRNMFEYIGECYAHGLMDGEVMRWVQAKGHEATIEHFTLV